MQFFKIVHDAFLNDNKDYTFSIVTLTPAQGRYGYIMSDKIRTILKNRLGTLHGLPTAKLTTRKFWGSVRKEFHECVSVENKEKKRHSIAIKRVGDANARLEAWSVGIED